MLVLIQSEDESDVASFCSVLLWQPIFLNIQSFEAYSTFGVYVLYKLLAEFIVENRSL